MKCDLWTREVWDKHFKANKVIVCTADVLHQCLMHSFIKIRDLNLLILDEAHHAKKGHAYAQIIRDFYVRETDHAVRPRIFGMTASPVDAKVDVVRAARSISLMLLSPRSYLLIFDSDLEDILCSRIATTVDMALLQRTIYRPHEEIVRFLPGETHPVDSDLYLNLKSRFGDLVILQPLFQRAKDVNACLGRWCADYYWTFALADKKAQKLESRLERSRDIVWDNDKPDTDMQHIKEAIGLINSVNFSKPHLATPDVSPKLISLYNYLIQYFERPSDHRCIVFVEQRNVARLLYKVFDLRGGSHLRPGILTGSGSGRLDDIQATFRNQVVTLMKFRKGELNCLFATSVAEEGLDVPDCNLIIRFDICKTMIQYVQSRGRARHKHSRFLHMLEMNNPIQDRILQDNRYSEILMRKFCEALPADRRLGIDDDSTGLVGADESTSFTVPNTGATITFGSCLQLLGHFVSSLPRIGEESLQPAYVPTYSSGSYLYEVQLPSRSPIQSFVGKPSIRKAQAKRSAAFEACVQLFQAGFLNDQLVPIYHSRKLPLMRNAALALNMKKTGKYTMRAKPNIWEKGRETTPMKLYAVVLDVSDSLDRPHRPLVLLTRIPLPDLPEFPLFLSARRQTLVRTTSISEAISVSPERLEKLTVFTLRIFNDVFNKEYEFDVQKVSYWLAPKRLLPAQPVEIGHASIVVDWAVVDSVAANEGFSWTPGMADDFLLDKFLVDPYDGGRRFFTERLAPEHRPLDPVPSNSAPGKRKSNIIDYSVSLWSRSRKDRKWHEDQPVIEAEKVRHRRNMLAEPYQKEILEEQQPTRCYLCPEPLKISAVSQCVLSGVSLCTNFLSSRLT